MKNAAVIIVLLFGALLGYAALDFPPWGDPAAPASVHVSPYYITHTIADTAVPNMVTSVLADYRGFDTTFETAVIFTAVLADYRGYDTLFETIVIFSAGVACLFLMRVFRRTEPDSRMYRHLPSGITLRVAKGYAPPPGSREFERIDLTWVPYNLVVKTTSRLIVPFSQLFALYVIAHGHHSPGG